jgi:riboflavin synthase
MMRYIVEKGYVAVDGVSLTVAALDVTGFTIAMIAYTREAVIMGRQRRRNPGQYRGRHHMPSMSNG